MAVYNSGSNDQDDVVLAIPQQETPRCVQMVATVQKSKLTLMCICIASTVVLMCISRVIHIERLPWSARDPRQLLHFPFFNITSNTSHKPSSSNRRGYEENIISREARTGPRVNHLASMDSGRPEISVGPSPPPLTTHFIPLAPEDIKDLRTFVMFVGFGRTGHSIVGSLLDAHPDIIIAHEYNVLKKITPEFANREDWLLGLFNRLFHASYKSAVSGSRSKNRDKKGYTLGVEGNSSWQGRVNTLRVIGDKSGSMTADLHSQYKDRCPRLLRDLKKLRVSVTGVHIMRNPYDTVATRVLSMASGLKFLAKAKNSSKPVKHRYPGHIINRQINEVVNSIERADRLLEECPMTVKVIHLADLIYHPHSVLQDLCTTMSVECYSDYLNMCEKKIFKTHSKTRYLLDWPREQMNRVSEIIRRNPQFARYSFDSD